ncbi:MAG: STAS/SEC14 domain-containing protein [bacterium]|jgi:hypothetical protein
MANRVFLNPDGYIEVVLDGKQSYMTIDNMKYTIQDLINQLEQQGKPRLGLVDLTTDETYSPDSNKAAMQTLESLNYEKIAMFGAGEVLTEVTKAIILAIGRSHNTKIFKSREEAVKWLLEGNNQANTDQK